MKPLAVAISLSALLLARCSTYTVPNYGISADANVSLKALKLNESVRVGATTRYYIHPTLKKAA